jgi:hypothetical protein
MEKEYKNLVLGCNKCQQNFTFDKDDFSFYEKMKVPVPNVCPDCRFKIRALWRNEMSLYSGQKCNLCQKNIISMYNPKGGYNVYCYDCWFSNDMDARDYALLYNKEKSFFEQFNQLLKKVPKINLYTSSASGQNINSEFINFAGGCKDCYFCFNTDRGEDVMYSRGARKHCTNSLDLYFTIASNLCYEGVNVSKSSSIIYGQNITSCVDCYFVKNCSGLSNCFGCINLRNKSNCWFNEQLTNEEYKVRINEVLGSYKKFTEARKQFEEFCLKFPNRENNNIKVLNSLGDYLFECNNVKDSFEVSNSENCKYGFSNLDMKDSVGTIGFGKDSELLLETVGVGYSNRVVSSVGVENSQEIFYSFFVKNSKNCIGCDGLKNAEYCILNKQYTKEEYEKLKDHIIKELTDQGVYGLMIPPQLSPFAYNETIAQDNMPLTKEEVIAQGFRWEDNTQMTKGKETIDPEDIPDHINDITDEITKEILRCIECERNYKIMEQELLLYRKMKLPIPRKCFFCRHQDRVKRRGPFKFFKRNCDKCSIETYTNLTKEVAPIMYCEECYKKEVY